MNHPAKFTKNYKRLMRYNRRIKKPAHEKEDGELLAIIRNSARKIVLG